MAQRSVRRGWNTQGWPQCFKHAEVIGNRSANSHTGRRQRAVAPEAGQMAASDHAPTISSFPLA
jgi:hypothetical protein